MGKVNACLKRSFVIVTSLIGLITGLLLAFTLFTHGFFHKEEEIEDIYPVILVMYIFSILTLLLVIIGLYGARKEKQWALVLFAVGMIFSCLSMIASEIRGWTMRPKIAEALESHYLELVPLANASESFLHQLSDVQMNWYCCGMDRGFLDWGYSIPESCVCTEASTSLCVAAPRNSSLYENKVSDEVIMIYSEPCLPYLVDNELYVLNLGLGIHLGILLLWVLSASLCITILRRLNRKVDAHVVVFSQEAKAGNYTVLTEATEHT